MTGKQRSGSWVQAARDLEPAEAVILTVLLINFIAGTALTCRTLTVFPARRRNGLFFLGWTVPGLMISAFLCAYLGSVTWEILSVFAATGVLLVVAVKYDRRWERAHGHERPQGR